jgi:threonine dehydrogenase-like Zn-dependent dehydrogenase
MEVARVSDCRATGFAAGDLVGTTFAHKTGHIADPRRDLLVRLPPDLDPILGIYVAQMGPIAANGILHADAERHGSHSARLGVGIEGRPVLVMGAGVVGILTALFAQTCGASDVIIADPSAYRRDKAEAMGIEAMTEDLAWRHAKARWHDGGSDRGVDFVFQTRARSESLHAALRALRPQGTVVDLAFYQGGGDQLRLGEEFHHNGLSIRCAQINRVPRGLERFWDRRRLAQETVHLLRRTGGLIREHVITHEIPLEDAPTFLARLLEIRPDFLQIVFRVDR